MAGSAEACVRFRWRREARASASTRVRSTNSDMELTYLVRLVRAMGHRQQGSRVPFLDFPPARCMQLVNQDCPYNLLLECFARVLLEPKKFWRRATRIRILRRLLKKRRSPVA